MPQVIADTLAPNTLTTLTFDTECSHLLLENKSSFPIELYLKFNATDYNVQPVIIEEGGNFSEALVTDAVKLLSKGKAPFQILATPTAEFSGQGLQGENAYVYIAYASDASGTDFTLTFDEDLSYIAILATDTEIPSPAVGDFAGLWKRYGYSGEARSIFYPTLFTASYGDRRVLQFAALGNQRVNFMIPNEAVAIMDVKLLGFCTNSQSDVGIDFVSDYCGNTEINNSNSESDTSQTFTFFADERFEISLLPVLSVIAPGDDGGVKITLDALFAGTINIVGVQVDYTI